MDNRIKSRKTDAVRVIINDVGIWDVGLWVGGLMEKDKLCPKAFQVWKESSIEITDL